MKEGAIKQIKQQPPKSKAHLKYEKLLADIEKRQKFQDNLRIGIRKAHAKTEAELTPLLHREKELTREFVIRLDELATQIGIGKFNKEWVTGFIADVLNELLLFFGHNDSVLSALYEKYTGQSLAEIAKDESAHEFARSVKETFGFDVDVEELLRKGHQQYFEEHAGTFFKQSNQKADENQTGFEQPEKLTEDEKLLEKDAKLIYMRLIKKFHPDVVQDIESKQKHTDITKQVTEAYRNTDFFNLLKLQFTYLEDNEKEAVELTEDLFKQYTKLLQKQLNKLKQGLDEMRYTHGDLIDDLIDKNGNFSQPKFAAQLRHLKKSIDIKSNDLDISRKRPKSWFKDQIKGIKETVQASMFDSMFDNSE